MKVFGTQGASSAQKRRGIVLSKLLGQMTLGLAIGWAAASIGGCGFFAGESPAEAAPTASRPLLPTFTPTAEVAAPAATAAAEVPPTQVIEVLVAPEQEVVVAEAAPAEATATESAPKLTVQQNDVNTRLGPGTQYGLAGLVSQGQEFTILGSNAERSWWQICCVNGKEVWIFGELARRENDRAVPVIAELPPLPAPVAQAPPPTPLPPTAEPTPQPPPAADPCAGIGGDGCKFKLRGGPKFAPNGGTELKLQLHFIHSGIDGGQPQGSYFVWLEKDGQKLAVSDGVRSILVDRRASCRERVSSPV